MWRKNASKIKVIAALGLCGVMLSPSLKAMEKVLKLGQGFVTYMQHSVRANKTSEKALFWQNVQIESIDDLVQLCLYCEHAPNLCSAEVSAIAEPVIVELVILGQLKGLVSGEMLQEAVHAFGAFCKVV